MIRAAHVSCLCLLSCLGLSACAAPPAPGDEMSEAEQNLAAIRTLLFTVPSRAPSSDRAVKQASSGREREESPSSTVEPLRWPASEPSRLWNQPLRQPQVGGQGKSPPDQFKVVIPWRPDTGSSIRPEEAFRPVPPYRHFPAVGSIYPGTPRCVPDPLGGQRCGR